MDNRLGKWLMIFGLILWLVALWKASELPVAQAVQAELLDEPVQVEISRAPIEVAVGGIDYQVKPLYKYDLYGMVVSKHNADTWWDFLHKEWNDKLNITDLCVVWGNNVRSGSYREIDFSSGHGWVAHTQNADPGRDDSTLNLLLLMNGSLKRCAYDMK